MTDYSLRVCVDKCAQDRVGRFSHQSAHSETNGLPKRKIKEIFKPRHVPLLSIQSSSSGLRIYEKGKSGLCILSEIWERFYCEIMVAVYRVNVEKRSNSLN